MTDVTVPVSFGFTFITTSLVGFIRTRADPDVCAVFQFPLIDTLLVPLDVTGTPSAVTVTTEVVLLENVSITVVVVLAFCAAAVAEDEAKVASATTVS